MSDDRIVFAPGDKVMRVGSNRGRGTLIFPGPVKRVEFGKIYCVEDFWRGPRFNVIVLVGFGGWRHNGRYKVGFYAGAFRKVEEIQLCVKAAQQMKAKEAQTV